MVANFTKPTLQNQPYSDNGLDTAEDGPISLASLHSRCLEVADT